MFSLLFAETGWGPFRWLAERMREAADWLYGKLVELWDQIWTVVRSLGDTLLEALISAASSMFPDVAAGWSLHSGIIAQANYFFPLSETLALATVLFGLWVLVLGYKLVKSWIPTVAS